MITAVILSALVATAFGASAPETKASYNNALDADLAVWAKRADLTSGWMTIDGLFNKYAFVFDLPLSNGSHTFNTKGLIQTLPAGLGFYNINKSLKRNGPVYHIRDDKTLPNAVQTTINGSFSITPGYVMNCSIQVPGVPRPVPGIVLAGQMGVDLTFSATVFDSPDGPMTLNGAKLKKDVVSFVKAARHIRERSSCIIANEGWNVAQVIKDNICNAFLHNLDKTMPPVTDFMHYFNGISGAVLKQMLPNSWNMTTWRS